MRLERENRFLWIGSTQGGLGWLRNRIEQEFSPCLATFRELPLSITCEELESIVSRGVDRVIVACADRLSYPAQLVKFMQCQCPDVPLAIAGDNWWDGARRTGLGASMHLVLPWYRWWDGWSTWITGQVAEQFGPFAECRQSVAVAERCLKPDAAGLIIANCRQTGAAWSATAAQAGFQAQVLSWKGFERLTDTNFQWLSGGQWILWDDSSWDTYAGCRSKITTAQRFSSLELPSPILHIFALSMPRIEFLEDTRQTQVEVIAKPSDGGALQSLLEHHFRLPASSAALART